MITVNAPFIIMMGVIIFFAVTKWLQWYLFKNEEEHTVRREKVEGAGKKDGWIHRCGRRLKEIFVFGKADLKRPWYIGVPAGLLVLLDHFLVRNLHNEWLLLALIALALVILVVFDIAVMLRTNREFFSVGDRRKRYLKTQTAQGILSIVLAIGFLGVFFFDVPIMHRDSEGVRDSVKWAIEPAFSGAPPIFSEGLAAVGSTGKMGYIDKTGEIVIPLRYNRAYPFREGLAAVQKDWRWGYLDAQGNVVIPFQYDEAYEFSGGLAPVEKDNKWYVIDRSGNVRLETEYDYISAFREGMAIVQIAGREYGGDFRYNLIDSSGNLLFKRDYDEIGPIGEGCIFVREEEGGIGYFLDRNEERVIPQGFVETTGFSGGIAGVMLENGEYLLIDRSGAVIRELTEEEFIDLRVCDEGLVRINNTAEIRAKYYGNDDDVRYGFRDLYGNIVVPVVFRDVSSPGEGMIGIEADGHWGFIENPLPEAARGFNPELWESDRTLIGSAEGLPIYAGELESCAFLIGQKRPKQERILLLKQAFEELKIEKAFEKHGKKMEPEEIRYQIGHEYYKKLLLDKSI